MTAADSLQVGGSATPGPGAWRGTRSLVSPRLLGSYSSSLSNPPNIRRILVSRFTIRAFPLAPGPAHQPRFLLPPPEGAIGRLSGRALAALAAVGLHRLPPAFVCLLASQHDVFPLVEVTAFLNFLELGPLLHSLQVPATSAPPGNVSSSSPIRLQ